MGYRLKPVAPRLHVTARISEEETTPFPESRGAALVMECVQHYDVIFQSAVSRASYLWDTRNENDGRLAKLSVEEAVIKAREAQAYAASVSIIELPASEAGTWAGRLLMVSRTADPLHPQKKERRLASSMITRFLFYLEWEEEAQEAVRQAEEYCDELIPPEDPENAAYKLSLRADAPK